MSLNLSTLWAFLQEKILNTIFFIFGEIDFSAFNFAEVVFDILLVTTIIYFVLQFIARLHAFQIIFTTIILALLLYISSTFNLVTSKIILQGIVILALVSIPLMFQQEIRKTFEKLGNSPFLFFRKTRVNKRHALIKAVKQASGILAQKQHGALIVIEKTNPLHVYAETGIPLHADVSKELLMNIFFPKSPLHDGAIIIRDTKVLSAGAVLPLTHTTSEYIYGTRHKSAIGLSEVTDAIIIVISEERGEISIASEGKLKRNINLEDLENYLEKNV